MDKANKNIKEKLGTIANGMGAWLIILILIVVMTLINDKFFTVSNFINVFRQVCDRLPASLPCPYPVPPES